MRSLRVQLILGTALTTAAVLLVSGVVLYASISRALWTEFDQSLAAKARSLATLFEQDDGLECDLGEVSLPEFEPSDQAEYYQVWLPDGTVFARSPSLADGNLTRIAATLDAPDFATALLPNGRRARIVGFVFEPRRENDACAAATLMVTLAVARETRGLQATLARVRGLMVAVCLAAIALSTGVLICLIRRSLRPVAHLSSQIAEVGEDDLSKRIAADRMPRELSPVVDRLNDLLARLEAAFERERRFTGDVAHELRTPLAGLRAKLELALSRERTPQAYCDAMTECREINLQMQRMVENLLHLARADAGQLDLRSEPVDVAALARDCWTLLEERAAARGLRIEWSVSAAGHAQADPATLRLILQNLLDNAVTYADAGSQIGVSVSTEDEAVVVCVRNGGGPSPQDVHHVFDRFWRASHARRSQDENRCGLGLPLCKALIKQLGGTITAAVSQGGVFSVNVRLPLASTRNSDAP